MIDLYLLCADLKNEQSDFRKHTVRCIAKIYFYLTHPSRKTADMTSGWKEDFQYIYGNLATNLSGNSRLDKQALLAAYGIPIAAGENGIEGVQLLIFSIQTYFNLLTKYILQNILQSIQDGRSFSHEEIISGDFAKAYGIDNYCCPDWYCWPLFELHNGFSAVMDEIRQDMEPYRLSISVAEFQRSNNYDFIKQIYESLIPKELRHALGEYYTPDWLAESTLNSAIDAYGSESIRSISILDPTCGSGTFLFQAIAIKRRNGNTLSDILATVRGVDINPLAVLTAKTNYILSVLDLIDPSVRITIPVYLADIIHIASPVQADSCPDLIHDGSPAAAVRSSLARDQAVVSRMEKADIITGNPPWVNWEYLPAQYRQESQHYWKDYHLFSAKGRDLSFSKEDISILITYIVVDKLLKNGGIIGFVIRQGIFKSAQNGVGFRRFRIGDTGIKVLKVEDLSKIHVFENAMNSTALFFARKGEDTSYPVPYYLWEKRRGLKKCFFGPYSRLHEVMSQIRITGQYAIPAVKDDRTSIWLTAGADSLALMKNLLGTNAYKARTGVFTGGANAVYWLRINGCQGEYISVTNVVERAKRKAEQVTAEIEKTFVYPLLKGSNVRKWNVRYDTYLLCPHTAETRIRPVPGAVLAETAPKTMQYLSHFKPFLDTRNGFAGWEKQIQQQEFHAILRVGDYTFSRYKVIWKYIARTFICAVISTVDDKFLGEKPILPNEKIMYVSTQDEAEAYYLCGLLSSTLVAECVKSYMNPTSISAHILNKLNIPSFDRDNPLHQEISRLCKDGHGKQDIAPYIAQIDCLVKQIYGV